MLDTDVGGAVEFRILGPLEVAVAASGRSVVLGGLRPRRLLAALLVNANADVQFDRLVDVLWDEPPRSAKQQVHNVMAQLRTTLELGVKDVALVTVHGGYRITVPPEWLDALRFESDLRQADEAEARGQTDEVVRTLRRALDRWRGPALAGLSSRYLANVAARLDEQRLAAVERLVTARLLRRESGTLVSELIELVAENPLREAFRASLMEALHREGRQAEALAVFAEGRRLLADELGLAPGAQLRKIHEQVLRGDPAPYSDPDADTAPLNAAGASPVSVERVPGRADEGSGRHFLPRDSDEFTGRTAEVARLTADARSASACAPAVSAIDGMGGVGKTTLAVHAAHVLAEDYPDGQYFVDLHGFTPGVDPLSPSEALQILLWQSGVPPERVPADVEGRSALWRSHIAGQRVLLLLDNAVDVAPVRHLLPGTAGALVLITSRRRLAALEGARPLSLDALPLGDAVALFVQVAGADRVIGEQRALTAVVEHCSRLPLAVRIAAARFRERRAWSLADLVDKLCDQRRRARFLAAGDRDVLAVLALSHRYLTPEQRRIFRLLSLHPGDFEPYAVAALAGVSRDEADAALEVLFEDSLLLQRTPGRYHFHDLVRDCSGDLLRDLETSAVQRAAVERLLDYYLFAAHLWCQQAGRYPFRFAPEIGHVPDHVERIQGADDAIRALRSEQRNLLAALQLAREVGSHAHVWQLTCALQPVLGQLVQGRETVELFERSLASARHARHRHGESICTLGLIHAHLEQGSVVEANRLLGEALETMRAHADNLEDELHLLSALGRAQLRGNLLADARSSLLAARALAERLHDHQSYAELSNNLGAVFRELGDFPEALCHFRQRLSGDAQAMTRSRALTLNNIAHVMYLQGSFESALIGFKQSLDTSLAVGSRLTGSWCLIGLCATHRALGEFAPALESGREALEVARTAGLREAECEALCAIGDVFVCTGSLVEAQEAYDRAAHVARGQNIARGVARAEDGLAHVHLARDEPEAARALWESATSSYTPLEAGNVARHLRAAGLRAACRRCETRSRAPVECAPVVEQRCLPGSGLISGYW